jgi:tricorn protease
MGPVFDKRVGVYALALQPDARFPFKPEDELTKPEEKSPEAAAKAAVKSPARTSRMARRARPSPRPPQGGSGAGLAEKPASRRRRSSTPACASACTKCRSRLATTAPAVDDKRLYLLDAEGDDGAKGTLKTLAIARSSPQPETFAANVREFGSPPTASTSSTAPSPRARRATC